MLACLVVRSRWAAFTLLLACSFDGSGLNSAGTPGSTTTTTTGDASTSTTTSTTVAPPTTGGPDGSASASDSTSTTTPVDPTDGTTTSTTTTTTGPGTTDTTTTTGTTEPDTTTTTGPDTTTGSTTTGTDTGSSTGPDTTTGEMCVDTGKEPNETEATAIDLGNQGCKADPKSFSGVLDGETDVDWYHYHGTFSGGGCGNNDPDPLAAIVVTADDMLEVCLYADCDNGNSEFTCPNGTTNATSPDGRPGCCGPGSISYTVNCSQTGNESAEMYVRLRNAPVDACLAYKVDYSYHN